jgi:hypothetical protein
LATLSVTFGRQASVPGDVTVPELLPFDPLELPLPVPLPLPEPFDPLDPPLLDVVAPLDEPPGLPPDEPPFVVPPEDPLVCPPEDPAPPPLLLEPGSGGVALPQLAEPHWSVPSAVKIVKALAQLA